MANDREKSRAIRNKINNYKLKLEKENSKKWKDDIEKENIKKNKKMNNKSRKK
ncbi:MAG: hypothetical protein ACI4OE_00570 [Alphaproteobacteria bacterium]|nr:hypothetical protein [Alphaproteobacteria bacterium]MDY4689615.1 hypothetical protein [Alphaproteobacteria bacterium]